MRIHHLTGPLAAVALTLTTLAAPEAANAATATFSYFGAMLNTDENFANPPSAPFAGNAAISGQFTLDCTGIGSGDCANLPFTEYGLKVTDYSFSLPDGGAPILMSFANRNSVPSFRLSTDADRNMTFWSIVLSTTGSNCPALSSGCNMRIGGGSGLTLPPFDFVNLVFNGLTTEAYSLSAGTFVTAPVPLPAPLLMFMSGIAAMTALTRRSSSKQG